MTIPAELPHTALAWRHGVTSVQTLGGMLGPTVFVLPDGRQISPLHVAPWADETDNGPLPGILQRLRGEWPCVPFGSDADRAAVGDWPSSTAAPTIDVEPHGFASNHHWQLQPADPHGLELSIAYPPEHPIAALRRRVVPDPEAAALNFELAVTARRSRDLPIGLHPVFRLPRALGAARIEVDGTTAAATLPGNVDATSIFAPGEIAEDWHRVRLRDGSFLDPASVPFARHTEEVLQLLTAPGRMSLWNRAEGYRISLSWDIAHFPSLMLWFSNFGRQDPPWRGRHLALGVEPICGALDLGPQISAKPNPISARGVPTTRHFAAGETSVTRYRIAVESAPVE